MKKQKIKHWDKKSKFGKFMIERGSRFLERYEDGVDFIDNQHKDCKKANFNTTQKGYILEAAYLSHVVKNKGIEKAWHSTAIPEEIKKEKSICLDGNDDNGGDIVVEFKDGNLYLVQCKNYNKSNLTKNKMNSSFVEGRKFGKHIQFVTTCETIDTGGKLDHEQFIAFTAENIREINSSQWAKIVEFWRDGKEDFDAEIFTPSIPQRRAYLAACAAFEKGGRFTFIAPTGIGKSYASLLIKPNGARTTLILAPRKRDNTQWAENIGRHWPNARILMVNSCEDVHLEKYKEDALYANLPITATLDVNEIREWQEEYPDKESVAICTYCSLPRLIEAGLNFDYAIIDEAHHVAGHEDKRAVKVLCDDEIKIEKRLFTTATQKTITGDVYVSMCDEGQFGPKFEITDFEAEKEGWIAKIDVVIMTVTDQAIKADKGRVYVKGEPVQVYRYSLFETYRHIREDYPELKKTIFRFNRNSRGKSFSKKNVDGILGHFSEKEVDVFIVNSDKTEAQNRKALKDFETTTKPAILVETRMIDECWDCPAADSIVIADPMSSGEAIAQFVGRITRNHELKKSAKNPNGATPTVFVPMFIREGEGETYSEACSRTGFRKVLNILEKRTNPEGVGALLHHDYTNREEHERVKGATRGSMRNWRVEGQAHDKRAVKEAIFARQLREYVSSWSEGYLAFAEKVSQLPEGRLSPVTFASDFPEGTVERVWYNNTQTARKKASEERKEACEKIPGWFWNAKEALEDYHVNIIVDCLNSGDTCRSLKESHPATYQMTIKARKKGGSRKVWRKKENFNKVREAGFDFGANFYEEKREQTIQDFVDYWNEHKHLILRSSKSRDSRPQQNLYQQWQIIFIGKLKGNNIIPEHEYIIDEVQKRIKDVDILDHIKNNNISRHIKGVAAHGIGVAESYVRIMEKYFEENNHCRPSPNDENKDVFKAFKTLGNSFRKDSLTVDEKQRLEKIHFPLNTEQDRDDEDWYEVWKILKQIHDQERLNNPKNPRHILEILEADEYGSGGKTLRDFVDEKEFTLVDTGPEWYPKNLDGIPLSYYRKVICARLKDRADFPIMGWVGNQLRLLKSFVSEFRIKKWKEIGVNYHEVLKYREDIELAIRDKKTNLCALSDRSFCRNVHEVLEKIREQEERGKKDYKCLGPWRDPQSRWLYQKWQSIRLERRGWERGGKYYEIFKNLGIPTKSYENRIRH